MSNPTQSAPGKESFTEILIRSHPETALIHDIAGQLRGHVPIRSLDELKKTLNGSPLTLGEDQLPLEVVEAHLPDEIFPVTDEYDLATKLTAVIRTVLMQMGTPGSPATPADPVWRRFLAAKGQGSGPATRTGVFEGPSILGSEPLTGVREEVLTTWVVTLELRDCLSEVLLPYAWIFDGVNTYQFDANGQFIAVIFGRYENYALGIAREGYLYRTIVLTQSTMAGTTQPICLNPAP
ncbi:hypothetical protein SLUN_01565 [Streptomyces lunaelactis]|uniref:Uncharacterized protein n=1 Tax=Streptomyces lunaelactis TaxID=1535768 RepID=A0A2R4SWA4_9ACTN|nr:hypothetical protein [Streptomyces lunaelactis]AVZ71132.1 hypothetical protein SLUN_01565 [Streptomyces lunaelactis]NUK02926.1 hypothetical protein [Streptomyces lunaelactis]NUK11275.1 hypothetical protein [Streptomyces lunaelactis]NUK17137.1 hypothetical protein [Streptomyces lunaelactis]NUK22748.1 hypothetical protein [Streptomyces lunaelactis]